MKGKQRITMPPLRPYELPDAPATVMAIPPERDEYAVPGEHLTPDEIRSIPRAVLLPPLRPDEVPESAVKVLTADPNRLLDQPEWGTAKKTPEIALGRGKMLYPWED